MMHNSRHLERGQAMMISTIIFVIISTTVLLGLGSMISGSQRLISNSVLSEQAFYLAEAGAEAAAYGIMHGGEAESAPTLYGQSALVQIVDEDGNQRVTSTGTIQDVSRTVEVLLSVSTSSAEILSWKEPR